MKPGTPGFVGERLKETRLARGMSASDVSREIDVTRQAVSQYENGQQSPAPDVMERISEKLDVPIRRFLRPYREYDIETVFYRSMASATRRARMRAEGRFRWWLDIVAFIDELIELPSLKMPDLSLPDDPQQITDDDIEDAALAVRSEFGMGDGPIDNVVWQLEGNGITIARQSLESAKLDAFSCWCDDRPYIVVSHDKRSTARSRFSTLHELGHLLMHRKVPQDALRDKGKFGLIEKQADRFASAMLLPESSFAKSITKPSLDGFRSLKSKWNAAIACMIYRATDLHILTEQRAERLWMSLARRGWKRREPLDDTVPPEKPRVFLHAVSKLIEHDVLSQHELPFELALPDVDVEKLMGLTRGYFSPEPPELAIKENAKPVDTVWTIPMFSDQYEPGG